jgi:hypothetical protein
MKKKLILFFAAFMLIFLCLPAMKTFAADGYAVDAESGETVDELSAYILTTGSDADFKNANSFIVYVPGDTKEFVVPITFDQKGLLNCSVKLAEESDKIFSEFGVFTDEACTNKIYYSTSDKIAAIPKAGTYYLKFSVSDYSDPKPENYAFGISARFINGNDKSLKDKEWLLSANLETTKPIYYKITVPKAGGLTVNLESEYSSYVTLLNSSKKAISEETYYYSSDGAVYYAVAKGTYYVKVKNNSNNYRIRYTFKAISDLSGTAKAKAKKLTAGKAVTGVVTATDTTKKVDWYKITLPKSQKVDITFTGSASSGKINLEFYGGGISGSITQYIRYLNDDASFSAKTWTSDKLPKGTYYIKITKDSKNSSGSYTLKLNK